MANLSPTSPQGQFANDIAQRLVNYGDFAIVDHWAAILIIDPIETGSLGPVCARANSHERHLDAGVDEVELHGRGMWQHEPHGQLVINGSRQFGTTIEHIVAVGIDFLLVGVWWLLVCHNWF